MSSRSYKKKKQQARNLARPSIQASQPLDRKTAQRKSVPTSFALSHVIAPVAKYALPALVAIGTFIKTQIVTGSDAYENGLGQPAMAQHETLRGAERQNQELSFAQNFLSKEPKLVMGIENIVPLGSNLQEFDSAGIQDNQSLYLYHPCSFYEEKDVVHKVVVKVGYLRQIKTFVDSLSAVSGEPSPKFSLAFFHISTDDRPHTHAKEYIREPALILTETAEEGQPRSIVASPLLLAILSLEEAKTTIAHEFGHIQNKTPGDTKKKREDFADSVGQVLYPHPQAAMSALGKMERQVYDTDFFSSLYHFLFRHNVHTTHVETLNRAEKIEQQYLQQNEMTKLKNIAAKHYNPAHP
jgi:hypothetical protein